MTRRSGVVVLSERAVLNGAVPLVAIALLTGRGSRCRPCQSLTSESPGCSLRTGSAGPLAHRGVCVAPWCGRRPTARLGVQARRRCRVWSRNRAGCVSAHIRGCTVTTLVRLAGRRTRRGSSMGHHRQRTGRRVGSSRWRSPRAHVATTTRRRDRRRQRSHPSRRIDGIEHARFDGRTRRFPIRRRRPGLCRRGRGSSSASPAGPAARRARPSRWS